MWQDELDTRRQAVKSLSGKTRMHVIRKAWAYYHEFGPREFIRRIQHRKVFSVFTKKLADHQVQHVFDDVEFRVASTADIPLLNENTLRWEVVKGRSGAADRMEAGDIAILGVSTSNRSNVLYISWVTRDDQLFRICADPSKLATQACSRRIWVPDQYRRMRLAERGLSVAENAAFQSGIRQLWAFALSFNAPSIRLHEKLGYENLGLVRVGRHLGKRIAQTQLHGSRSWQDVDVGQASTAPQ
jgi:RimJ/RimL family protein N-acetyltransferase